MLIRRWRRGLLFLMAMDLDQPLKFLCALAAVFYSTFRHCSSSTIPHISVCTGLCNAQCGAFGVGIKNNDHLPFLFVRAAGDFGLALSVPVRMSRNAAAIVARAKAGPS
jgi:hypothetical protein